MAESKKPRRLLSTLHISFRSQRRSWILAFVSIASVGALILLVNRFGGDYARSGNSLGQKATKFEREREDERVAFPQLPEMVERDRLWPPDLGKC